MQDGINKLADAVGVTLGPRGMLPANLCSAANYMHREHLLEDMCMLLSPAVKGHWVLPRAHAAT